MNRIDLILPCFNPAAGWSKNLTSRFKELQARSPVEIHLIIVNDGSNTPTFDDEITYVRELIPDSEAFSYEVNRGKGFAIRKGFKASRSPLAMFTDIDLPYTTESMLNVIESLMRSSPPAIVAGQRSSHYYESIPTDRKLLSLFLRRVFIAALNLPVNDTQCGLKGFSQQGKELVAKSQIDRFLFDLEVLTLAAALKATVAPVDVRLHPASKLSRMRLSTLVVESVNLVRIVCIAVSRRVPFLRKELC